MVENTTLPEIDACELADYREVLKQQIRYADAEAAERFVHEIETEVAVLRQQNGELRDVYPRAIMSVLKRWKGEV